MIVDPIHENDSYDAYRSLEHGKNKYLAHHHFRYASSAQERLDVRLAKCDQIIQEAVKKHSYLDTSPSKLHTGKFME